MTHPAPPTLTQQIAGMMTHQEAAKRILCEDVENRLVEVIGDFLDSEDITRWQVLFGFSDPEPTEKTELHQRMAKAAMLEYAKTIIPTPFQSATK